MTASAALPAHSPRQAVRQSDAGAGPDLARWPLAVLAGAQGRRAQHLAGARSTTSARLAPSPTTASAASASTPGPTTACTCSTCRTRAAPRTGTSMRLPSRPAQVRDLTPIAGVNAHIDRLPLDEPSVAAIAINDRDKAWHDLYRVDIATGERELLFENREELSGIVLDRQLRPRVATRSRAAEGGSSVVPHRGRRSSSRSASSSTRTI